MKRKLMLSLALSLCVAPAAFAQEFLPPAEIADRVLSAHPDVLAAKSRSEASRSEANRLAADPYEWTLSGAFLKRTIRGIGEFSEYDAGVTRGIRLPGKVEIDQRIGRYGASAAENAAEDARHQTALRLLNAWLAWLSAREAETIVRQQIVTLERNLAGVEKRVGVHDAAEIELEMARAALAEARAAAARSTGAAMRAEADLAAWFPELSLPANAPGVTAPQLPDSLDALRLAVVENSHEIGYVEDLAKRASALADRASADRMPDPQIGLRWFSERNGEETGLGVTFAMPLGGSARSAAAYEQYAIAAAARQDVQRVRRDVTDIAEADTIQIKAEFSAWQAAEDALADSSRVVQRLRDGYSIGASSLSELLTAERRHLDTALLEADARARANHAILKLKIDAHEMWLD